MKFLCMFNVVYHSVALNLALSRFCTMCSLPDCLRRKCTFLVKLSGGNTEFSWMERVTVA